MIAARELTNRMAAMLRSERGSLADFLFTFSAFHAEKRWRELGHGSAFAYLRGEFKLSEGAAYNRIVAAELIHRIPEVEAAVRSGELCFSTVHEVAKVLTPENKAEVLPLFLRKSRREAERIAASLRPAEVIPLREVVTAIRPAAAARSASAAASPAPAGCDAGQVGAFELHLVQGEGADTSGPRRDSTPIQLQPDEVKRPVRVAAPVLRHAAESLRDEIEPLTAQLSRMHFTVDDAFLAELQAAKNELAHACPSGSAVEVLRYCLRVARAQHAKRRGLVEKPLRTPRPSKTDAVPAHVKRAVWQRAGGRCEVVLESGERCDCTRKLELDHIVPLTRGGESTVENLRLACRPHNLLAARRVFGDEVMDRYAPGRRADGR